MPHSYPRSGFRARPIPRAGRRRVGSRFGRFGAAADVFGNSKIESHTRRRPRSGIFKVCPERRSEVRTNPLAEAQPSGIAHESGLLRRSVVPRDEAHHARCRQDHGRPDGPGRPDIGRPGRPPRDRGPSLVCLVPRHHPTSWPGSPGSRVTPQTLDMQETKPRGDREWGTKGCDFTLDCKSSVFGQAIVEDAGRWPGLPGPNEPRTPSVASSPRTGATSRAACPSSRNRSHGLSPVGSAKTKPSPAGQSKPRTCPPSDSPRRSHLSQVNRSHGLPPIGFAKTKPSLPGQSKPRTSPHRIRQDEAISRQVNRSHGLPLIGFAKTEPSPPNQSKPGRACPGSRRPGPRGLLSLFWPGVSILFARVSTSVGEVTGR